MVSAAKLDTLLVRFAAAIVACVTPADVTNARLDLHRAICTAGRTDAAAVAMIDGAVVPKKLWDAYAPRFTALLAVLDALSHKLHAAERAGVERRRVATLRLRDATFAPRGRLTGYSYNSLTALVARNTVTR